MDQMTKVGAEMYVDLHRPKCAPIPSIGADAMESGCICDEVYHPSLKDADLFCLVVHGLRPTSIVTDGEFPVYTYRGLQTTRVAMNR